MQRTLRTFLVFSIVMAMTGCGKNDIGAALALEARLEADDATALDELNAQAKENAWAALALGRANQLGIGKRLDLADAMYNYSLARDLPAAWYNAGLIYAQHLFDGLPPESSQEPDNACFSPSAKSATMKAIDCFSHAAESPKPIQARIALGFLYKKGQQELLPNPALSCQWFGRAAEEHDNEGRYQYALCLLRGEGVAKDGEKALHLLMEAAKGWHVGAVQELANLFGGSKDKVRAAFWHVLLAEMSSAHRKQATQYLASISTSDIVRARSDAKAWLVAHGSPKVTTGQYIWTLPVAVSGFAK